jgi:putative transposase
VIALIREAGAAGARLEAACAVLDVSPRTWQRWQAEGEVKVDGRHAAAQARTPANALSPAERQHLLGVANGRNQSSAPLVQATRRSRARWGWTGQLA